MTLKISEHLCCLLFQLVSATDTLIQAHHSSSDFQVESIELTLQTTILTGSCRVSVSPIQFFA